MNKEPSFLMVLYCYGSVKTIRFSYSNEDTKDEEKERVSNLRGEISVCGPASGTAPYHCQE
jgi:hypothetical protein